MYYIVYIRAFTLYEIVKVYNPFVDVAEPLTSTPRKTISKANVQNDFTVLKRIKNNYLPSIILKWCREMIVVICVKFNTFAVNYTRTLVELRDTRNFPRVVANLGNWDEYSTSNYDHCLNQNYQDSRNITKAIKFMIRLKKIKNALDTQLQEIKAQLEGKGRKKNNKKRERNSTGNEREKKRVTGGPCSPFRPNSNFFRLPLGDIARSRSIGIVKRVTPERFLGRRI
ncbi:hypothetical protein WN51_01454 [Melipona quadrifasciata]|uniref:Uncharacterized protein n=1 Tax=Melipona quadrifasciata TaxID=166423 RepID=A0A0M8ZW67_9HYME|nr:hypothetical protein WN51_01454 [Melipona quadrifasciata]